jgi:opacity protein-like surface antigen
MTLIKHLATAALVSAITIPSASAESGFYSGASYGNAKNDKGPCNKAGAILNCDKEDNGLKILIGYQSLENLAIEFDYLDLGESKFDLNNYPFGLGSFNLRNGKTTYNGWGASLVPRIKIIDNLHVFARVGFIVAEVETKTDVLLASDTPVFLAKDTSKDEDASGRWGVGLQYDLAEHFAIRVEYEEFRDIGDSKTTGQVDNEFTSVGVIYKF